MVLGRKFLEECSGYNAVKYFPYLRERLDAIKEIKHHYDDIHRITNFGRQMANTHGSSAMRVRLGSIPLVVLDEALRTYGEDFLHNQDSLEKYFKANPEWSFVYGR